MNDIENAIHDKKAEIKKANHELSKLQDELRNSNKPLEAHLEKITFTYGESRQICLHVSLNKPYDYSAYKLFKKTIESLSDKPKDEPRWGADCLIWACKDKDGQWWYSASRNVFSNNSQYVLSTLTHRPGVKE